MDFYNNQYMNYRNPYNVNQQMQNVTQAARTNLEWITVSGISQVEQVNVAAGTKAWIMVQNEPIFALRTADNMGLVTTEYYRFEKYEPMNAKIGQNIENYVTREEMLAEIKKAMEGVKLNESTISEHEPDSKRSKSNQ